ncbi:hypothetical protein ACH5RR_008077 [Cinchona calisaya]|uniref:Uncharacterized protein n=1 Tax=Cinchona calisaya TaxID=153742 RepID=A0ABD3AAB9_9GENT
MTVSDPLSRNEDGPQIGNEDDAEESNQSYFSKENSEGEIFMMPGAQLTEKEEKEIGGFINSIYNASMLFFDSTLVGRILTRASSDFSVLYFNIPLAYASATASTIETVVTIGFLASVTLQVLIALIFATIASQSVQVLVEQDLLDHYQQFVEFQGLVVQHVLDLGECHE